MQKLGPKLGAMRYEVGNAYLIIRHLLLSSLLSPERDGVADELAVLLDKVLQTALL